MTATVYRDIQQTRPFRSVEEEAYIALRLTSQALDQPWARYLRAAARISPSQYNLLRILRGAGDVEDNLSFPATQTGNQNHERYHI